MRIIKLKIIKMEIEKLKELLEQAHNYGCLYESTLNEEYSFEKLLDDVKFKQLILPVVSRSKRVNLVIDSTNGDYILTDRELKEYEDNELFMDGDKVYKAELVKEY